MNNKLFWEYRIGDSLEQLKLIEDESIRCCITSPPYWRLRDYGIYGQIGLEETLEEYISRLVSVFREVKRILQGDGTLWINMGDCYSAGGNGYGGKHIVPKEEGNGGYRGPPKGMKRKDLIGLPWMLAFALRDDGWYLRSDIIWSKTNPMPESVKDRPTRSHEYVFLLSKSIKYYYDNDAIKEDSIYYAPNSPQSIKSPHGQGNTRRNKVPANRDENEGTHGRFHSNDRNKRSYGKEGSKTAKLNSSRLSGNESKIPVKKNKRSVWTISTQPFSESHFATFPERLIEPMILAGSQIGDIVLDPFVGSGTTLQVCKKLNRSGIGIDLNSEYKKIYENHRCGGMKELETFE